MAAGTLTRVVYFSRNAVDGPPAALRAEIDAILVASQRNNARCGVTGALIFNAGVFGQVLEGPEAAVEDVFARIQIDLRHRDVTLLEIRPVSERAFARWSMGYVGDDPASAERFADIAAFSAFEPSAMAANDLFGLLQSLARRNELRTRAA